MQNPRMNIPVLLALILAACTTPTGTPLLTVVKGSPPVPTAQPTEVPEQSTPVAQIEEPLYLALVWHQHQPLYYKDENGVYTRPWVRAHATKDYYDMASIVKQYPDVHVTYNLTPVLIRQLDDFTDNGAKDIYWVLAEKPAAELSEVEKRFILERFFDANWTNIVGRFPGYKALLDQRGGSTPEEIDAALQSFSEQDFRDLQIWFNLAWFDPDFLEQEPLKNLVEKDRNFTEEEKAILFGEVQRVIQAVIPLHKQMQDDGQVEIITTPYAHPILPLLYDTNLALVGNPNAELPSERFSYPNDAITHLEKSVDVYTDHFGQPPLGLWPGEGAVAEEVVPLVADAGYKWMATGENVLAASLGIGSFSRNSEDTVQEADQLYRPYYVQGDWGEQVMMIFRDLVLSDKVGFTYSQTPGEQAAQDFIDRLENIRGQLEEEGAQGPNLVSVILDGENAWEYYPNDGKAFLHALYQKLSESETIKTVTPSEYMEMFPEQRPLESLFPGAWFSANYDTWIGEPQEAMGWDYLREVREDLAQFDILENKTAPSSQALQQAQDFMYLAEGSDWFWWYGSDQDSGVDNYFDLGFRSLLKGVYTSLDESVPTFLEVPIIPENPETPSTQFAGLFTPTVDGKVIPEDEWANAAVYPSVSGAMAKAEDLTAGLFYGLDAQNLYLRVDSKSDWDTLGDVIVGFYLYSPRLNQVFPYTHSTQGTEQPGLIGFGATNLFESTLTEGLVNGSSFLPTVDGWMPGIPISEAAAQGQVLEMAVPLSNFGEIQPGDELRLTAVLSQGERDLQQLPSSGPAQIVIPDLGLTNVMLEVSDPESDDNGPGKFTYPTDTVFEPQVFDLKTFSVGSDEANIVFKFTFYGPIPNPWGSPNNLAIQTIDVYVDKDPGAGTGARLLLPGRNASLKQGYGWEYAVWAEGWTPQFVAPDEENVPKQVTTVDFKIIVDPAASTVTLRVPRDAFGEGDPITWGYAATVMSQDGFPSAGVWRVRDGQDIAAQWRFGGVPASATNYPRIFDLADSGDQAQQLTFTPSTVDVGTLTPDDFAQISLLIVPN